MSHATAIGNHQQDNDQKMVNSLHFDLDHGHHHVTETDSIDGSSVFDDASHGSPLLGRAGRNANNSARNHLEDSLRAQDMMAISALISSLQAIVDDLVAVINELRQRQSIISKSLTYEHSALHNKMSSSPSRNNKPPATPSTTSSQFHEGILPPQFCPCCINGVVEEIRNTPWGPNSEAAALPSNAAGQETPVTAGETAEKPEDIALHDLLTLLKPDASKSSRSAEKKEQGKAITKAIKTALKAYKCRNKLAAALCDEYYPKGCGDDMKNRAITAVANTLAWYENGITDGDFLLPLQWPRQVFDVERVLWPTDNASSGAKLIICGADPIADTQIEACFAAGGVAFHLNHPSASKVSALNGMRTYGFDCFGDKPLELLGSGVVMVNLVRVIVEGRKKSLYGNNLRPAWSAYTKAFLSSCACPVVIFLNGGFTNYVPKLIVDYIANVDVADMERGIPQRVKDMGLYFAMGASDLSMSCVIVKHPSYLAYKNPKLTLFELLTHAQSVFQGVPQDLVAAVKTLSNMSTVTA